MSPSGDQIMVDVLKIHAGEQMKTFERKNSANPPAACHIRWSLLFLPAAANEKTTESVCSPAAGRRPIV